MMEQSERISRCALGLATLHANACKNNKVKSNPGDGRCRYKLGISCIVFTTGLKFQFPIRRLIRLS